MLFILDYFVVTTTCRWQVLGFSTATNCVLLAKVSAAAVASALALFHCQGSMYNQPLDARCSVDKISLISGYVLHPVIFYEPVGSNLVSYEEQI